MQESSRLIPYKLQAQCNAAIAKLEDDNRALDVASKSLDNFIYDNKIISQSFDTLKNKASDYKLVIRAMKVANDLDITDYRILHNTVNSEVLDGRVIEIKRVSENNYRSAIENAEKMRRKVSFYRDISSQMAEVFEKEAIDYEQEASNYQTIINHCNRKIEKYDSIEARTSVLFLSGTAIRTQATDMLSGMEEALLSGVYNIKILSGSREALIDSLNTAMIQINFSNNMKKQFGFDEKTTSIMWNIYSSIKSTYTDDTQKEKDYKFARIISQLFYNEDAESSFMEGAWAAGAGSVNDYDTQGFITGLGISEEDYNYLHYTVRLQHMICSGDEKTTPSEIDEEIKEGNGQVYYDKMKKGLSIDEIDRDSYIDKYEEFYEMYKDKPDFTHMMYTISAALVSDDAEGLKLNEFIVNKYGKEVTMWENSETRIDYTGWLGDATWPGVKKDITLSDGWDALFGNKDDGSMYGDLAPVLNSNTSFGEDDYMADLDADNIIHRINKNTSLMEAINDYYLKSNGGQDRAKEFLGNNSYTKVEKVILERAGVSTLDELEDKWKDSYDFLVRLKEEGANVN